MNSYSFHPKALINTLRLFLVRAVDKAKVELLFADIRDDKDFETTLYSNEGDKVKRKRVLLSSDYRSAFKVK